MILAKPYVFPCVDATECVSRTDGCFDATHLLSKVRSCSAADTKAEIYSTTAPAAADKADAADAATGDAVFQCISTIRKMYENKAACDAAPNNACRVAMKACYVDVAKTAIATTLGVEEATVTRTQVEAAVFDGAVTAVKDTIEDCMTGIKNSATANSATYTRLTKTAAQKACAAAAAKDTLVTSYGLSDATELKAGAVEAAVGEAAGKSMIEAIKACTATGTKDAASKVLCVDTAGKKAWMTTQGLDFDAAANTVTKSDVRIALTKGIQDQVATTVTECAKLATTEAGKRKCRWTTLKATLASANGESIDDTTTAGQVKLGQHVKKGASFAVRKMVLACMRAAKAANPSDRIARHAAFKLCREDKVALADSLAKPLADVTKADLASAVHTSGAQELGDRNRACRKAAMALATPSEQKAALVKCFTASVVVCADALGVDFDPTKKTENADSTMNVLKFEEVRQLAKSNELGARAAACKEEGDRATACTSEDFARTIVEAYGTDAAGEPTVDIAAAGGTTKLAEAIKDASITIIDASLDACTGVDSSGVAISTPGTSTLNGVMTCVKDSALASGYDVLTDAAILPGRPVDAPTKEKLFDAELRRAVMKKICYRFRECAKDPTKDTATCKAEIIAFAKRFFQVRTAATLKGSLCCYHCAAIAACAHLVVPLRSLPFRSYIPTYPSLLQDSTVDAADFVRKALYVCRASLIAQANECDATTKADCKAALDDSRTTTKDAPGPTAPATTNADGKAHSANVDRDVASKRAAAETYAACKLATMANQWVATKPACVTQALEKWTSNGGNPANWNDYWKAKIEKLGEAISTGVTIDVVTLKSVDYDVTISGTCASGGATKVAKINTLAKTACGGAVNDCAVMDREQVEIMSGGVGTDLQCKYRFRITSTQCTDKTSCDTLATTMAGMLLRTHTRRTYRTTYDILCESATHNLTRSP